MSAVLRKHLRGNYREAFSRSQEAQGLGASPQGWDGGTFFWGYQRGGGKNKHEKPHGKQLRAIRVLARAIGARLALLHKSERKAKANG